MTKRLNAKYKIDRRLGVNLWGREKSPFNVRPNRPGQHGAAPKKPTDYGLQLLAKQRIKGYYANIGEKQFRRIYKEASRRKGDTSENLMGILESRLDSVIYRMKFAITMFAARQFINHGHITVNGKKVNIPSYQVKVGDVISIAERSRNLAIVAEAIATKERELPDYVSVDNSTFTGTFLRVPSFEEIPYPCTMDPKSVIEFYSR